MRSSRRFTVGAGVGLFIVGTALGNLVPVGFDGTEGLHLGDPREMERSTLSLFRLTSPYLECMGERDHDPKLRRARRELVRFIDRQKTLDSSLHVSVYARNLLNGPWIGIEEDVPYHPASLLKVPVLFHALARMESDPGLADRAFVYPGPGSMASPDNLAGEPDEDRMTEGQAYTFRELLERMIVFSDNHAKDMVMSGVDPAAVDEFMAALGIPAVMADGEPVMNARSYGSLFRMLFNSTVFSRPVSEYALDLLSRSRFSAGLRAPLPDGVVVASKFGTYRDQVRPNPGVELHECGIVYAGQGPYALCVMSSSLNHDEQGLSGIISEVSRMVYEAGWQ